MNKNEQRISKIIVRWVISKVSSNINFFGKHRFNAHFSIYCSSIDIHDLLFIYLSIPGICTKSTILKIDINNKRQSILSQINKIREITKEILYRFGDSKYMYYKPIFDQIELDERRSTNVFKNTITRMTTKETFISDFDYFEEYNIEQKLPNDVSCVIPIDKSALYAHVSAHCLTNYGDDVYHMYIFIPEELARLNKLKDIGQYRQTVRQDFNFSGGGYNILLEDCIQIKGSHIVVANTYDFLDRLYEFAIQTKENFYKIYQKNFEHDPILFKISID